MLTPAPMPPKRTPMNFAIEHAEYMAARADQLLEAIDARDALTLRREESDDVDGDTIHDANCNVGEHIRALRSGIYEFRKRRDRALASAPPTPSADDPWRSLFNEVARLVNCLPSSFPDANDHVLRAIKTLVESAPSQGASMPQYWSVTVTVDGQDIVSIGHDWLSGNRQLEQQNEQAIVGAAQHLLQFVGYGLPPSNFDPSPEAEVSHDHP